MPAVEYQLLLKKVMSKIKINKPRSKFLELQCLYKKCIYV